MMAVFFAALLAATPRPALSADDGMGRGCSNDVADPARGSTARFLIKTAPGGHDPITSAQNALHSLADSDLHIDVTACTIIGPTFASQAQSLTTAQRLGLDRWVAIEAEASRALRIARRLEAMASIAHVEPMVFGEVSGDPPNDPHFHRQYALHNVGQRVGNLDGIEDADIDALEAWDNHQGNGLSTVAIIDTGVDPHADFFDRLLPGWNAIDGSDETIDGCAHGTHLAGIIGALANNGLGVAGVNPACNLLPVKVTDGCVGTAEHAADGIIWAADHGADVCNISLAFYSHSRYLEDAVRYAAQRDVVLVAAAGNFKGNVVAWPARFDEVIAVSATNNRDELADFSNHGDRIELAAPGRDIYSTFIGGTYTYLSGTSTAAPFVSATASLVRSFDPALPNADVRAALVDHADDLGPPGRDSSFGHGRVNARRALDAIAHDRFRLHVGAIISGENATIEVTNASPRRRVFFLYSFKGTGSTHLARLNVTIDLNRPRLIDHAVADEEGTARVERFVAPTLRDRAILLQAAQRGRATQLVKRIIR